MKGLAYSTTAIFTSLTLLGMLFKVMHWPGAGIALVLGVAGISLIVIPIVSVYKYRRAN
ncbi:MAG: hypothetical protein HRT57_07055 [Crocinitomicaceae bacterium]|nr:hypothetical protein [Crocinitomicaceae bacterium]